MAENVIMARRPESELGQVECRDLMTASGFKASGDRRIRGARCLSPDLRAPTRNAAVPVEHVLVREWHTVQWSEDATSRHAGIGRGCGGDGRIVLESDHGIGALVHGAGAGERLRGRLDAGDFAIPDGFRKFGETKGARIHYHASSASRAATKSPTSACSGNSSDTERAVSARAFMCGAISANRSGGTS